MNDNKRITLDSEVYDKLLQYCKRRGVSPKDGASKIIDMYIDKRNSYVSKNK